MSGGGTISVTVATAARNSSGEITASIASHAAATRGLSLAAPLLGNPAASWNLNVQGRSPRSTIRNRRTVSRGEGQTGRLLSYTDDGTSGNVNVLDPNVVGSGEWLDYKFVFAGSNTAPENGIYAMDPNGRLLFFTEDELAGNIPDPNVVGFGGWLAFKFLFAGEDLLPAENRIYAVPFR